MNQDMVQRAIAEVMPTAIATGLFVSLATFQAPSGTLNELGVADGLYNDVAGLVDIPCTAPPPSEARIQATENRALAEIVAAGWHHCLLDGYFPEIDAGWRGDNADSTGPWRMLIDGIIYDIAGVESDSQGQMTRITARLVTI